MCNGARDVRVFFPKAVEPFDAVVALQQVGKRLVIDTQGGLVVTVQVQVIWCRLCIEHNQEFRIDTPKSCDKVKPSFEGLRFWNIS